jgi:hypothetical protein
MIVRMVMMSHTERAVRIVIVVPIAVVPIDERIHAIVWMPPSRPIAPIIRRMPADPCRSPEPIVDQWSIDIDWFDDVVCAIDILVANYLYGNLVVVVFLYKDRRNILVDILC